MNSLMWTKKYVLVLSVVSSIPLGAMMHLNKLNEISFNKEYERRLIKIQACIDCSMKEIEEQQKKCIEEQLFLNSANACCKKRTSVFMIMKAEKKRFITNEQSKLLNDVNSNYLRYISLVEGQKRIFNDQRKKLNTIMLDIEKYEEYIKELNEFKTTYELQKKQQHEKEQHRMKKRRLSERNKNGNEVVEKRARVIKKRKLAL